MALESKSIDEVTNEQVDIYDSYIFPKKVWRNHNNKLYLIFRCFAAGIVGLIDAVLTLKNKFNPAYCESEDLYSTCRMAGTALKEGKGSVLQITITNKSSAVTPALPPGEYNYISATGMKFIFTLATEYLFEPSEVKIISAVSEEKGSYRVTSNSTIKVTHKEGLTIDPFLHFACADNYERLGYLDETEVELRERLLTEINRQDHLKELELKIRNLPNIFECNLIFNASENSDEYDGIPLGPRELLINITGTPDNKMAEVVASEVLYATTVTDPEKVVYYENDLYINGRYPVYYREHDTIDFILEVGYRFNKKLIKTPQVEAAISALFENFKHAVRRTDSISESGCYRILSDLNLPGVDILKVNIYHEEEKVTYLSIPKTRLPHLEDILFITEEYES